MNPVGEVSCAAKSAFTFKNLVIGLFTLLGLAALADVLGLTDWLLRPVTSAKVWYARNKGRAASAVLVFATTAAATATNGLWL